MRTFATAFSLFVALVPARADDSPDIVPAPGLSGIEMPGLLQDLDALFLLQDATAQGRQDAAILQKRLLLAIGEKLDKDGTAEPDRMAPYVAAYVLSGGDPEAAVRLAKSEALSPTHLRLLSGSALFMQGNRHEAANLLREIDISSLPARVGGRVALSRALLEQNPVARQSELAMAIAMMPGTLVEESAVRRSALAFAEAGDEKHFWDRLERYQRRFPDSLYAKSFWEDIMVELVKWSATRNAPNLTRLDLVLNQMPTTYRRDLYLLLTRESSRINNTAFVEFAASRTIRLAISGSAEDQTARLYLSLHGIASKEGQKSLAELKSLNRNLLSDQDRALLDAGLWITQQMNRPPDASRIEAMEDVLPQNPLEVRAGLLIAEVEKLLEERGS